jgi:(1->4)-alpha-D-glucan 1-alpha-D-glucosylmutase
MEQENFGEKAKKIFDAVSGNLNLVRRIPVAIYRLQFNHLFRFPDAESIIAYLYELGISDCYASPYLMAKKGSLHGYDILNHNQINPEIGTEEEYKEFVEELKKYGMGQILDIVPNHMNITEKENVWWMDILENGQSSIYADFFDIDWKPVKDELESKVLLPILGNQYGQVLENQELSLRFDEGAFFIGYGDKTFPVEPTSYHKILEFRADDLEKETEKDHPHLQELLSIITALTHLPPHTEKDGQKMMERRREKEIIKKRLWNLYNDSDQIRSFIDQNLRIFNANKENPKSFDLLEELLDRQVYRLSYWRVATEEINYRRFFDINELAAIRMEDPVVFDEIHKLIFKLIKEGKVTGLRVDHPDGLYNPFEYFYRLQKGCFTQICLREMEKEIAGKQENPSPFPDTASLEERIGSLYDEELFKNFSSPLRTFFYIVGEKILTKGERMPDDWSVSGTVGYVFLNPVNGVFIATENAKAFDRIYTRFIGSKIDYQDLFYQKKKLIMLTAMSSETNTLGHDLDRISEKDRHTRDFTLNSLTIAIIEAIACFPVYRTYVTSCGVIERDRRYIEQAISKAKRKNPALNVTVFDFLKNVLLLQYPEDFKETDKTEWLDFTMRFQQVCAPIMAKGLEDTLFYVYNRFVSQNEVGGAPEKFGTTLEAFHGQNIERSKFWPHGLITTSTHDTKRSEDVRARLNVLSEIPDQWNHHINRWSRINKRKKLVIDGQAVPDRNEEYLLYQTLVGVWPLQPMEEVDYELFKNRIKDYMLKAIREAKVNTSWISPNITYEEALLKFIDTILSHRQKNPFLRDFYGLQGKVAYFGMFNSLSQTLLKMTSPGVPDFYQGTEMWDFSLVDPDNRKPVNFDIRKKMLGALEDKMAAYGADRIGFARELMLKWMDGTIKLYVTFRSLNYRKENYKLFMDGTYTPLYGEGNLKDRVCAFARQGEGKIVLVIVPRFLADLTQTDEPPLGRKVWRESSITVPSEIVEERFRNIFTGEIVDATESDGKNRLVLGQVFANFPVALLEAI